MTLVTGQRHQPDTGGDTDIPFTDSGYGSAAPVAAQLSTIGDRGQKTEDNNDAKTVISAATTVIPTVAQHSITEVCNNIYNRIKQYVDEDNRDVVFGLLPDLIKTFALRLTHLDSTDMNRRIMHFVYSRHM